MPKPVIAAIKGAAVGAGLSIALACDIRYLAEDAVLMMAFSNIALVPDSGGSWFLPRVGRLRAGVRAAATGRRVRSDEALALGLVERVLPHDDLLPRRSSSPARSRAVRRWRSAGRSGCCAPPRGARSPT